MSGDFVNFSIGTGHQTISLIAPLSVPSGVKVRGTTQPGPLGKPLIETTGSGWSLGSNGQLKDLVINYSGGTAVECKGPCVIQNCFIGTD